MISVGDYDYINILFIFFKSFRRVFYNSIVIKIVIRSCAEKFLVSELVSFLTHLKSIKFCFTIPPAHYSVVIASILAAVVIFLATFTRCFD